MKYHHLFSLLTAILFFTAGCATQSAAPATDAETPPVGVTTGNAMLEAFRTNDADDFLALLPSGGTEQFGEKEFEASRKNMIDTLGELQSYEFLCRLEMPRPELNADAAKQPLLQPYIWKVRFLRKTISGRDIYQEMLFRVVIGELDGKPYVLSFGFI